MLPLNLPSGTSGCQVPGTRCRVLAKVSGAKSTFAIPRVLPLRRRAKMSEDAKLFVGSLSWGTDDRSLNEAFQQFGEIVEARARIPLAGRSVAVPSAHRRSLRRAGSPRRWLRPTAFVAGSGARPRAGAAGIVPGFRI